MKKTLKTLLLISSCVGVLGAFPQGSLASGFSDSLAVARVSKGVLRNVKADHIDQTFNDGNVLITINIQNWNSFVVKPGILLRKVNYSQGKSVDWNPSLSSRKKFISRSYFEKLRVYEKVYDSLINDELVDKPNENNNQVNYSQKIFLNGDDYTCELSEQAEISRLWTLVNNKQDSEAMADLGVKFAFGKVSKKDGTSCLDMAEYLYKESALRGYKEGARKVCALGYFWLGQSTEGAPNHIDEEKGNALIQWARQNGWNG